MSNYQLLEVRNSISPQGRNLRSERSTEGRLHLQSVYTSLQEFFQAIDKHMGRYPMTLLTRLMCKFDLDQLHLKRQKV